MSTTETLEKNIEEMPSEEAAIVPTVQDEPEPIDVDQAGDVLSDSPKSELRLGWIIAGLFFGVVVGFSFFARMDAAVYAPGNHLRLRQPPGCPAPRGRHGQRPARA